MGCNKDIAILYLTRFLRMFSYGMLAVVLFENLFDKGLTEFEASWVQALIVTADIFITLWLTSRADRLGRVNTLIFASLLKLTGLLYANTDNIVFIAILGVIGLVSVTGSEIGPFMPIEQSTLSQLVERSTENRGAVENSTIKAFGYYNFIGYLAQALGAGGAGIYINYVVNNNCGTESNAITTIIRTYAVLGGVSAFLYCFINKDAVELQRSESKEAANCPTIQSQSTGSIFTLSVLYALDAFAGAFIVQSYLSYYYDQKYMQSYKDIGFYLLVCYIVSGISSVLSSKLVKSIGAVATTIYIHLPSNILLVCVAFTNDLNWSLFFLMARFSISQMYLTGRQALMTTLVSPSERAAAFSITNIARSLGLAAGLALNAYFMVMDPETINFSVPFIIAGGLKIVYDIMMGCCFWQKQGNQKQYSEVENMELSNMNVRQTEEERY